MNRRKESKKIKLFFEDSYLIVIDKPSGWVVNDSKTTQNRQTVQGWLAKNFQFSVFNSQEYRNGIVHRLDKETSGLLIIAKTSQAFEKLQKQFQARIIAKEYIALVHGKVELKRGLINAKVGRLPWNRERFGVLPGGREAETVFKLKRLYLKGVNEFYSLLSLLPKTGRTHQIRVHLKYLGYPIVSDSFYAGRKTARKDRLWCPRLFLHASKIKFSHPATGKKITLQSPLPQDLKKALNYLKLSEPGT